MSTPSPTRSPDRPSLYPFEVLEQIGEGGMGVVYRARHLQNGRQVALKMLPGDVSDKTVLARFEREVEVLKNLKHPNIVRCFGGSCEDNRRFYAMELLQGGSLEDKLQDKGRLPWEQAVFYALQMCDALECSHANGVIHRDIKPSNFLLTPSGQIKLSDFGLASVAAARKITAAGKTAGTFLYMAPEQIRGHEVTPQTDLYALGCVLFELITGDSPFRTNSPAATLHKHCHEDPPRILDRVADCPVELEQIVHRLLEKHPADRFPSAAALSRALKQLVHDVNTGRKPADSDIAFKKKGGGVSTEDGLQLQKRSTTSKASRSSWLIWGLSGLLCVSVLLNLQWSQASSSRAWEKHWMDAARHENVFVRLAAMKTLSEMSGSSDAALATLAEGLQDTDSSVRQQAVQGLALGGASARQYVPQLIKAQSRDGDEVARQHAVQAIAAIEKSPGANSERLFFWGTFLVIVAGGGFAAWYYRSWLMAQLERVGGMSTSS